MAILHAREAVRMTEPALNKEATMLRKLVFGMTVTATALAAERGAAQNPDWTKPFPPFRMVGNVYWVGSYDLSTYLITTPAGNILINTGMGSSAPEIAKSVETLGFKIADTKILTATHGHIDHVAAMAALKRMTGAKLIVSEPEKALLESGGQSDFRFGDSPNARFDPVTVDETFKDGGKISLGGTELTAHLHPGHTKGATSFTLNVQEAGKTYRVIIANMGSINPGVTVSGMPQYSNIATDYATTFIAQKDLKIDVWLASHAAQFRMHEKHMPGDPYNPERFVDPTGYIQAVQRLEKIYLDQLAKERAAK
jgi:metallo-beta-lactamase class B